MNVWRRLWGTMEPSPRLPGILVCGVGRNVAHAWPGVSLALERTLKAFPDYHVWLYENDSTDQTVELWRAWARRRSSACVTVVSESLARGPAAETALLPGSGPLGQLTLWLSEYRNRYVKDVVLNTRQYPLEKYPWVLVLDLDLESGWSHEAVWHAVQNTRADVVAANGVKQYPSGPRSYDVLAYQSDSFPELPHDLGEAAYWSGRRLCRVQRSLTAQMRRHEDEVGAEVKARSAFGGMALYRRARWVQSGCLYAGAEQGVSCCEHSGLHRCLASRLNHFDLVIRPNWRVWKGRHGYHGAGENKSDAV